MLALPPFAGLPPETLSQLAVAVVIPSWLAGTEEACQIAEAARRAFGRLVAVERTPGAAYTAIGYNLCRIDHEAYDCRGPGRIMTLEHSCELFVASIMQTPLNHWFPHAVTFSARTGLSSKQFTDCINAFVDSQHPDGVLLAGAAADGPLLRDAVAKSHAAPYLIDQALVPSHQLLVIGAAQEAKDRLERHVDDCGELEDCTALRRKADLMAGRYVPPKPPPLPSSRSRRVEL